MRRKNKLLFGGVGILLLVVVLGSTTMSATTQFVSPTELREGDHAGEWVNLEGAVTDLDASGGTIRFDVTDGNESVPVVFDDTRPETLQNGRIVIAKGSYEDGRLVAKKLSVRAHEGSENGGRPEGT